MAEERDRRAAQAATTGPQPARTGPEATPAAADTLASAATAALAGPRWDRPAEADPPLPSGTIVDGRYRVLRLIGAGGMGRVYEAEHLFIRRRMALKLVRRDAATGEAATRLLQEAVLAGKVPHATVVPVFDCAALPDGQVYVAMELLRGESLEQALQRSGRADEALRWLAEVARGLAAAHGAGIVHRDIKPANIFLARAPDGEIQPKLLDFGIAKLLPGASDMSEALVRTQAGALLGTPYYMAPERVRGEPGDPRADLYGLGVILYEAVVGGLPFTGEGFMEIAARHVREAPLDPRQAAPERDVPDGLAALIVALLAKEPGARPESGTAVAAAIEALLQAEGPRLARLVIGPQVADGGGASAEAATQGVAEAATRRLADGAGAAETQRLADGAGGAAGAETQKLVEGAGGAVGAATQRLVEGAGGESAGEGGTSRLERGGPRALARGGAPLSVDGAAATLLAEGTGEHGVGGARTLLAEGTGEQGFGGARTLLAEGTGEPGVGGARTLLAEGTGEHGVGGARTLLAEGTGARVAAASQVRADRSGRSGIGRTLALAAAFAAAAGFGGWAALWLAGPTGGPAAGDPGEEMAPVEERAPHDAPPTSEVAVTPGAPVEERAPPVAPVGEVGAAGVVPEGSGRGDAGGAPGAGETTGDGAAGSGEAPAISGPPARPAGERPKIRRDPAKKTGRDGGTREKDPAGGSGPKIKTDVYDE